MRPEASQFSINYGGADHALARGQDFLLDDSWLAAVLPVPVTPRLADLMDIALAAYVVDRSQRRPGARLTATGRMWSRALNVRIGVRDVGFWVEHTSSLEELLHWLIDDHWRLNFHLATGRPMTVEVAQHLPLAIGGADRVALFSGGLDSLAGALIALHSGRLPMLFSIETNSRMGATQRRLRRLLREHFPNVVSASTLVTLCGEEAFEPSQRARAFLFLAVAGVAATACEFDLVEVYENGIGAIGLPYLPTQEGAQTTKAMHPHTLWRFSTLVTSVAGRPIKYTNPSLWSTKADLCRWLPSTQQDLIPFSESCDSAFSYRGDGTNRCGTCTSCLLRRQALWAAGLQDIDALQPVRTDVIALGCDGDASATSSLLAMLDQAPRLDSALRQEEPWMALTHQFPELREVAGSPTEQQAVSHIRRRMAVIPLTVHRPLLPMCA